MSGFVCILNRDGRPVARDTLEKMTQVLEHRGPDGRFLHVEDSLGLSHLLLRTGSGSQHERMPACSPDGRLWLTGDLRLDDRQELWAKCGFETAFDPAMPDSQLVLLAYEKWGDQCPAHLLGDFAFVLYDAPKRKLLAARDPFGVKPFYYHLSDTMLMAGSEMKALKTVAGLSHKLNESWLIDYMTVVPPDFESTIYDSIRKLPPASCLTVTPETTQLFKYWELDPQRELRYSSDAEYYEQYHELFFKAIARRLDSAAPIGAYLSGGLDTSSIVCVARKLLNEHAGQPLHTLSALYSACEKSDERHYIQAVVKDGGLTPHFFDTSAAGPASVLAEFFEFLDEPRWAYNIYFYWNLMKIATGSGVRVVLDGFDGDSTLSHGYGLFHEWAAKGQWVRLFTQLRAYCKINGEPFWPLYRMFIWRGSLRDRVPQGVRSLIAAVRNRGKSKPQVAGAAKKNHLFSEKFSSRAGIAQKMHGAPEPEFVPDHKIQHLELLQSTLLPYYLEVLDLVAAAQGIEPRYPFFDRELAEFCLAVPWQYKLYNGLSRIIAREGLADVFPAEIYGRTDKGDLAHGFDRNLNEHDRELILNKLLKTCWDIFDKDSVEKLRASFLQTTGSSTEKMLIWRLVCFNTWWEKDSNLEGLPL